jgi:putative Ca2+/H+ antiporter (TMEM165/GDT1 family)
MACFNLLFWVLAEIGAGWVAMKIAKRSGAVWVLAGVLGIYLAAMHLVLYWPRFPWWYNLGVVIPAIPAVLLGSKLARK